MSLTEQVSKQVQIEWTVFAQANGSDSTIPTLSPAANAALQGSGFLYGNDSDNTDFNRWASAFGAIVSADGVSYRVSAEPTTLFGADGDAVSTVVAWRAVEVALEVAA